MRSLAKQKTSGLPAEVASQHVALLEAWRAAEQRHVRRLRAAKTATERAAIARILRDVFGNKDAQKNLTTQLPASVVAAARKRARERTRAFAPLKKALDLEARWAAGKDLPNQKNREKLRGLFDKASRALSDEHRGLVRAHAARAWSQDR
jgi:hypothetical protein